MIAKESKIKISPRMAKVKIFLAESTLLESPPDVVSLMPE